MKETFMWLSLIMATLSLIYAIGIYIHSRLIEKLEGENHLSYLRGRIYLVISLFFFWCCFVLAMTSRGDAPFAIEKAGQFGDSFGILTCLFTGMAVVIAFHVLQSQKEEFKKILDGQELINQVRITLDITEEWKKVEKNITEADHFNPHSIIFNHDLLKALAERVKTLDKHKYINHEIFEGEVSNLIEHRKIRFKERVQELERYCEIGTSKIENSSDSEKKSRTEQQLKSYKSEIKFINELLQDIETIKDILKIT